MKWASDFDAPQAYGPASEPRLYSSFTWVAFLNVQTLFAIMLLSFSALLVSGCGRGARSVNKGVSAGFVTNKKETLHFKGQVTDVVQVHATKNLITAVHPDPRWVMSVKITEVTEKNAFVKTGSVKHFGIHRIQDVSELPMTIGDSYSFELTHLTTKQGRSRLRELKAGN